MGSGNAYSVACPSPSGWIGENPMQTQGVALGYIVPAFQAEEGKPSPQMNLDHAPAISISGCTVSGQATISAMHDAIKSHTKLVLVDTCASPHPPSPQGRGLAHGKTLEQARDPEEVEESWA